MQYFRCPGCGVVNVGEPDKTGNCVQKTCTKVPLVPMTEEQLSQYHEVNQQHALLVKALLDEVGRHADSACPLCAHPEEEKRDNCRMAAHRTLLVRAGAL